MKEIQPACPFSPIWSDRAGNSRLSDIGQDLILIRDVKGSERILRYSRDVHVTWIPQSFRGQFIACNVLTVLALTVMICKNDIHPNI